jgi:hypothetical protein
MSDSLFKHDEPDVNFVSNKIESMKNLLKKLVESPLSNTSSLMDGPTVSSEAESVVGALRAGKPAPEIYEILKKYAITNAQEPIITTDKNKVLYIDYNACLNRIFLYVGDRDDYLALDTNEQKQIWVLPFSEKYEFKLESVSNHVFRTLIKPDQILMTHADSLTLKGTYIPLLFVHVYEPSLAEAAKCHERIEWIPEKIKSDNQIKKEERLIDKFFASVATNCFPATGKHDGPSSGSGIRQILNNKLRPTVDPRDKYNDNDSDKTKDNLLIA